MNKMEISQWRAILGSKLGKPKESTEQGPVGE